MGDFSDYKNVCFFSGKRKHNKQVNMEQIKEECINLRKDIETYNISLISLSRDIATEGDRNMMLNIAMFFVNEKKLISDFKITKVIKKKSLAKITRVDFMKIQRYIDYLKLYIVLLMDGKYPLIENYLNIQENEQRRRLMPVSNQDDKQELYKGIAINISGFGKSIFVLTRQGIVADVQYVKGCKIGNEVLAKKFRFIPKFIKVICLILLILAIIIGMISYVYSKKDATVVIRTTSEINININSKGQVIDINSPTQKGKVLIEDISYKWKNIDNVIVEVLEFADKNEMIPNNGVVHMTITDDDFDLNEIPKTKEYVENQYKQDTKVGEYFKLEINNDGSQKTINPNKE
ncbi:MAG: anti-sigma-I factor RsgI family protein [Sarcina sp.]